MNLFLPIQPTNICRDSRNAENIGHKPQSLLKEMKVKIMCTTDDPTSPLKYHLAGSERNRGNKLFLPGRRDKAMNIEKKDWKTFGAADGRTL